jgi:Polysaccharide deacetylase
VICLTFDTDHLGDDRMREFVSSTPLPGSATLFCTRAYASIGGGHEVCPHAIVSPGEDWGRALDEAREMFPSAKGFRAHGCFYSHGLALELGQRGYSYVSSQDQIGRPDVVPQREIWGIWQLPIYYMDTFDISIDSHWGERVHQPFSPELIERAVSGNGLYVFAFHPIHLMLNSTGVEDYLARRDGFHSGVPLDKLRCPGYGAAEYYAELINAMEAAGVESVSMSEALARRAEFAAIAAT